MLKDEMFEFRVEHNLSQEKAAKASSITLQTWNQVERGMQTPSGFTEAKIRRMMKTYDDEEAK